MRHLGYIFYDTMDYFISAWHSIKPLWVFFLAVGSYVLFPDSAYTMPAIGLIGAVMLDIVTKYYAVATNNGGLFNSIANKKLTSASLWEGTRKKLIGCLVVMILCGLSFRVTQGVSILGQAFATIAYAIMFWRESQSVIENMLEAGHTNLSWLLVVLKKKESEALKKSGVKEKNGEGTSQEN